MKSFGIGLAILVAGTALYIECYLLSKVGELAQALTETMQDLTIGERLLLVSPYICLGIMAFGVVWFWIVEPILYFRRRKEQE